MLALESLHIKWVLNVFGKKNLDSFELKIIDSFFP
jgi:hypothetical protein